MPCSPTMNVLSCVERIKISFLFSPPSLCQTNIEPCLECGHLKQKHILCGFCYAKVCKETSAIRRQIQGMEGGPLRAPTMETVILYEGETPSQKDKDKRIVERPRKRPAWFSFWCFSVVRRVFVWQTVRLTFSWLNMYRWNTYILSILLTTKGMLFDQHWRCAYWTKESGTIHALFCLSNVWFIHLFLFQIMFNKEK